MGDSKGGPRPWRPHVTEKLQKLKALVKASAKKSTPDPLRNLKENKKWTVTLPLRVPEGGYGITIPLGDTKGGPRPWRLGTLQEIQCLGRLLLDNMDR